MAQKKLLLFLVAAVTLLAAPATNVAWSTGDDHDDDDDGFEEFFQAFFDKLFKQLKKMKNKIKQNMMAITDHEIRITALESITVVNGTDGQDGADGINGINGTDGADGQDGIILLYKVVNSTSIIAGYHIYEASCDPGDYAISGGYTVDAPNNEATDVFIDRDNGAGLLFGNMWTIGLLDDGNFDPPADISVTAICQDNP